MVEQRAARARVGVALAVAFGIAVLGGDAVGASQGGAAALNKLARQAAVSPPQGGAPTVAVASSAGSIRSGTVAVTASSTASPVPIAAIAIGSEDGPFAAVRAALAVPVAKPEPPPPPPPLVVPTSPSEWFNPRGAHEGTEGIVADLAKLGVTDNSPLYVNECWGRTWGASTSDHHASQTRSWACDLSIAGIQVPTPQTNEAARRIASALGEPGWKGGNLVKYIGGYRIQVLWLVEGHFNHVHVGARKL